MTHPSNGYEDAQPPQPLFRTGGDPEPQGPSSFAPVEDADFGTPADQVQDHGPSAFGAEVATDRPGDVFFNPMGNHLRPLDAQPVPSPVAPVTSPVTPVTSPVAPVTSPVTPVTQDQVPPVTAPVAPQVPPVTAPVAPVTHAPHVPAQPNAYQPVGTPVPGAYPAPSYAQPGPTPFPTAHGAQPVTGHPSPFQAPPQHAVDLGFIPGPPAPAKRRLRGGKVGIAAAAAVAVAATVGGGAWAAAAFLGGGGAQPEDVMPADTVAFAKLDLDPAAGQKIALARFASKFPALLEDSPELGDGDLRRAIFGNLFSEVDGFNYATDVEPWIGSRIGIGAQPGEGADDGGADLVMALAVTDQDAAATTLDRFQVKHEDFVYAFTGDYVLISHQQDDLDEAIEGAEQATLADAGQFRADYDSLDKDQIAAAWADLGAVSKIAAAAGESAEGISGGLLGDATGLDGAISGRVVAGLHADASYLEVQGKTFGIESEDGALNATSFTGTATQIADLPADVDAALGVSGLADVLTEGWAQFAELGGTGLGDEFGLTLPEDFPKVFGTDTAFGLSFAEERFTVRATGADPDTLRRVAATTGEQVEVTTDGDTVIIQSGSTGSGDRLGDSTLFKTAVPDTTDSAFTLYADLAALLTAFGDAEETADWANLGALGATVKADGDDTELRLRLTAR